MSKGAELLIFSPESFTTVGGVLFYSFISLNSTRTAHDYRSYLLGFQGYVDCLDFCKLRFSPVPHMDKIVHVKTNF